MKKITNLEFELIHEMICYCLQNSISFDKWLSKRNGSYLDIYELHKTLHGKFSENGKSELVRKVFDVSQSQV